MAAATETYLPREPFESATAGIGVHRCMRIRRLHCGGALRDAGERMRPCDIHQCMFIMLRAVQALRSALPCATRQPIREAPLVTIGEHEVVMGADVISMMCDLSGAGGVRRANLQSRPLRPGDACAS